MSNAGCGKIAVYPAVLSDLPLRRAQGPAGRVSEGRLSALRHLGWS